MTHQEPIVIVGAGIAGLAAAHRLRSAAPGTPLILVEGHRHVGGKITTVREDGFVVEGGPDSFLAGKPRGIGLCRELGLGDKLQGTRPESRGAFVLRNGRLHRMPEGFSGLVPSRLRPLFASGLLSPAGKTRAALEPFLPPASSEDDESIGSFMTRRFGRETFERVIEPLMAGIYAGDGDRLSILATFPQLRAMERERGSLLRAMGEARRPAQPGRSPFLTPVRGMGEIVDRLAQRLSGIQILSGRNARRISRRTTGGYRVWLEGDDSLRASRVILATPAHSTARILEEIDSELAAELGSIDYVSSATASLAYPLDQIPIPLDGTGYVVPRVEGSPVLACTWSSSKFAQRAPQGWALLRVFLGRAGQDQAVDLNDAELVALAREELRTRLGITAEPARHYLFRWPRAMPQYAVGHLDRLDRIERRLAAHPRLYLAGSAYRGIGIPDCIQSGEKAAERAVQEKSPAR